MPKKPDGPKQLPMGLLAQPATQLDMFALFSGSTEPAPRGQNCPFPRQIWFPHIGGSARSEAATILGDAGELLTMSEVRRLGFEANQTQGGHSHDIRAAWKRSTWRIQVKTVSFPVNGYYMVNLQKGYRNSPQGRRDYEEDAFDMVAIVILPLNVVIFTCRRDPQIRISVAEVMFAQSHPGNSLRTAFLDMLGNPALGLVPDREVVKTAFEAEWQLRQTSRTEPVPVARGSASLASVCERLRHWTEEAEAAEALLDLAMYGLCAEDDNEALEPA